MQTNQTFGSQDATKPIDSGLSRPEPFNAAQPIDSSLDRPIDTGLSRQPDAFLVKPVSTVDTGLGRQDPFLVKPVSTLDRPIDTGLTQPDPFAAKPIDSTLDRPISRPEPFNDLNRPDPFKPTHELPRDTDLAQGSVPVAPPVSDYGSTDQRPMTEKIKDAAVAGKEKMVAAGEKAKELAVAGKEKAEIAGEKIKEYAAAGKVKLNEAHIAAKEKTSWAADALGDKFTAAGAALKGKASDVAPSPTEKPLTEKISDTWTAGTDKVKDTFGMGQKSELEKAACMHKGACPTDSTCQGTKLAGTCPPGCTCTTCEQAKLAPGGWTEPRQDLTTPVGGDFTKRSDLGGSTGI